MQDRTDRRFGAIVRAIRRRKGLRQADVARMANVSQSTVARVEAGEIGGLAVHTARGIIEALGGSLELRPFWRGAAMDRLLDEGHAALCGRVAELLAGSDWETHAEVTFAHFGERGSIDLVAWHAPSRTLVVIEVKTELGSTEEVARRIDVKVRLAPMVAHERFGWGPLTVARLVVMAEERSNRRAVERHAAWFAMTFPDRNVKVRRWLKSPHGGLSGLLFLPATHQAGATRNPSAIQRVRATSPTPARRRC